MWKILWVVLWGACARVHGAPDQEYFSSITGLESLMSTEAVLLQELRDYVGSTRAQMDTLESELEKITREHEAAAQDMENYLSNPVNAYRVIKRLSTDWQTYEDQIRRDSVGTYFLERMAEHRAQLDFPGEDDLDGSAMALVRLQETYQLDVAQVAAGILNGIKYGSGMTWQDCFSLGQQLFALEDYNHTRTWFKESLNRLNREKYSQEPAFLDFKEGLAESLLHLGDVDSALELSNAVLSTDPERVKAWEVRDRAETLQQSGHGLEQLQPHSDEDFYHQTEEFKDYEKVCRGELVATPAEQRPLRCRYVSNGAHHRLLAPFKVEEHSLDPLVWTIHDVIADRRIDTLKQMAMPWMLRSTVRATKPHASTKSNYRISKNAWLKYHTHPYMLDMLRELRAATGLDMTHCEELQVANYGLGGHYEPHFDFYMRDADIPDNFGNRIATAIFYLSDVDQGGATAFPHLRVAVRPQKGNVLFWYNLHRSLDLDYRTKHAGCPVLKGSKWIGNVWIRSRTQAFSRPCDLRRDHEVSLPYEYTR